MSFGTINFIYLSLHMLTAACRLPCRYTLHTRGLFCVSIRREPMNTPTFTNLTNGFGRMLPLPVSDSRSRAASLTYSGAT